MTVAIAKAVQTCSVPGCSLPVRCKGVCEPHYQLIRRTGGLTPIIRSKNFNLPEKEKTTRLTFAEKFWSKVAVTADPSRCWEWQGGLRGTNGYGSARWKARHAMAHRVAWTIANGREPGPGKFILHGCDNPLCCNPAHLREGTQAENMQDMVDRNRSRKGKKGDGSDGGITPPQQNRIYQTSL